MNSSQADVSVSSLSYHIRGKLFTPDYFFLLYHLSSLLFHDHAIFFSQIFLSFLVSLSFLFFPLLSAYN